MGFFKAKKSQSLQGRESNATFAERLSLLEESLVAPLFTQHALKREGLWLQVDRLNPEPWALESVLLKRIILNTSNKVEHKTPLLRADLEQLPCPTEALSGVLCVHALEYQPHPWLVLEEIDRVLEPAGVIILFSFNPYSLWGIHRYLDQSKKSPWDAHFHSPYRLHRFWLQHNYEVLTQRYFMFSLPGMMQHPGRIEWLGQYCWPSLGGCCVWVVRKQSLTLTPIKTSNWLRRSVPKAWLAPSKA